MILHTYIPYSNSTENITNLGAAYNAFMELVNEDDWVCFLDHDATFTTRDWHPHIVNTIKSNPEYGLFTCMANRIGNPDQKFPEVDPNTHDITYHRVVGSQSQSQFKYQVDEASKIAPRLISGVILVLNKKTWKITGGFENGFLGVDNCMHESCLQNNIKVGIMRGTYVYHWYRGDGNEAHIKLANQQNENPWFKKYNR